MCYPPSLKEDSDCALTVTEDPNMLLQERSHVLKMNSNVIRMATNSAKKIEPLLVTGLFSWISSLPSAGKITESAPQDPGFLRHGPSVKHNVVFPDVSINCSKMT